VKRKAPGDTAENTAPNLPRRGRLKWCIFATRIERARNRDERIIISELWVSSPSSGQTAPVQSRLDGTVKLRSSIESEKERRSRGTIIYASKAFPTWTEILSSLSSRVARVAALSYSRYEMVLFCLHSIASFVLLNSERFESGREGWVICLVLPS
jgi:hypothetical protein